MNITTQDIIKMLPFEQEFKTNLLGNWDKLSPDQRFTIEQIVWDAYAFVYQNKLEENTNKALVAVETGKEKLNKDMYRMVREKTEKELEEQFQQTIPAANLAETREALQDILNNSSQKN